MGATCYGDMLLVVVIVVILIVVVRTTNMICIFGLTNGIQIFSNVLRVFGIFLCG